MNAVIKHLAVFKEQYPLDGMSYTYGHHHTIILFVSTAASEESNDEDDGSDNNQEDCSSRESASEEVEVGAEVSLDNGAGDDQTHTSQLK